MKIMEIVQYVWKTATTALHVGLAPQGKRMHLRVAGLRLTLQYGGNEKNYENLSLEELHDRLSFLDYQLCVLEDEAPENEDSHAYTLWCDAMEELEEQFDEVLAALERLERKCVPLRKLSLCA